MEEEVKRAGGAGIGVVVERLEYGDCMFEGSGENGSCVVGVERKRLQDLVNSMVERRLSGSQLRGMYKTYDYIFLVAEGIWRRGKGGEIEELRGREWRPFFSASTKRAVMYRQLAAYLTTLELRGGVRVRRTERASDTAALYVDLWHWFNDKDWAEHRSHDQIYTAISLPGARGKGGMQRVVQREPGVLWKMAAQLPGLDRKAEGVADHFQSVRNMALAGLDPSIRRMVDEWLERNRKAAIKEWMRIPGVGKGIAETAVQCIEGQRQEQKEREGEKGK